MSVKLSAALGFAAKAGKIRSGDFTAEKLIKSGEALLIVLDSQASEATQKKWKDKCSYYSVDIKVAEGAAKYVGRTKNRVFVVTDEGFCKLILNAAAEDENNKEKDIMNQHGEVE
ncbi:MAG: ribosomal L7Ae/L30e/S12e/Gadd45 family protein [Clostridia bacterium]|nr:ribosomal L7Ae/L30e/S12e/Gadd45 family protein [Clostridia bacterium]